MLVRNGTVLQDPQKNKEMRTDGNKISNIGDTVRLKWNILFEIHKVLIQLISRPLAFELCIQNCQNATYFGQRWVQSSCPVALNNN
jgi:hypothetical protein